LSGWGDKAYIALDTVMAELDSAFLTLPFGFALFYMKGVAPPSVTTMHIDRGVVPFVPIQMFAVILCMNFPDNIFFLPRHRGMLD